MSVRVGAETGAGGTEEETMGEFMPDGDVEGVTEF